MFDKILFAARLKQLRLQRKLSAAALARETGVTNAAISQFENAVNYPHVNTLTALADYFDVSLDYLTGRSDCPDMLARDKDGNTVVIECMAPPKK